MSFVIQLVGYKNSGKTTLMSSLLRIFNNKDLNVAVIKHDVHGFESDPEGTDTYLLRQSGAKATAITSPWRTAIIEEQETDLAKLIERFNTYDIIMVEGFKREDYPKIVLIGRNEDYELVQQLSHICAVVFRDEAEECRRAVERDGVLNEFNIPCFGSHDIEEIASWITDHSFPL